MDGRRLGRMISVLRGVKRAAIDVRVLSAKDDFGYSGRGWAVLFVGFSYKAWEVGRVFLDCGSKSHMLTRGLPLFEAFRSGSGKGAF